MICIVTLLGIFQLVSPTCQNINNEQYDFIIISPANFSEDLVPLVDHKEQHSISTKIITLDEIYQGNYFPANGRDDAEQIKYFLKDAKENWNISYVMLVGGKEELPGRYVDICSWGEHYKCFSDLYYADIYDENGSFCSWDSNNDNVFAGQSMEGMVDEVDLSPDVAIGRLLCQDPSEVQIVVEKIINYEKTAYDEQWFRNLILCGGDEPSNGPSEGDKYEEWFNRTANTIWEGEYLGDKVAEIMKGFTAKKIYATGLFRSDINFINFNPHRKIIKGKIYVFIDKRTGSAFTPTKLFFIIPIFFKRFTN